MQIAKLNSTCFTIKTGKMTIVINPDLSKASNMATIAAADIVLYSLKLDLKSLNGLENNPFVIQGQGEYEIGGVSIFGYSHHLDKTRDTKNVIYNLKAEDISVCYLGGLRGSLSEKMLEEINGTDILIIPVENDQTLNSKQAVVIIGQIEPKIVIPMSSSKPVDFLKEGGWEDVRYEKKLRLKKSELTEETTIMVLE